jgi:hypothetical protein
MEPLAVELVVVEQRKPVVLMPQKTSTPEQQPSLVMIVLYQLDLLETTPTDTKYDRIPKDLQDKQLHASSAGAS